MLELRERVGEVMRSRRRPRRVQVAGPPHGHTGNKRKNGLGRGGAQAVLADKARRAWNRRRARPGRGVYVGGGVGAATSEG